MKPKIWSNFGASVHSDSATICISLSNFTVKDQSFCFRPCESYSPGSFFPAHNADFPGKDTTANRSRAAKSRSRILWAWEASLPSKVERAGPAAQVLISENRGTRSTAGDGAGRANSTAVQQGVSARTPLAVARANPIGSWPRPLSQSATSQLNHSIETRPAPGTPSTVVLFQNLKHNKV